MTCEKAVITDVVVTTPDQTVTQALKVMDDNRIRRLPVIDEENHYLGSISLRTILRKLLPAAVTMEEGLTNLEFLRNADRDISGRLDTLSRKTVSEIMATEITKAHLDTSLWEAIRILVYDNSPVPVVDEATNKFIGILTFQSVLGELRRKHPDFLG